MKLAIWSYQAPAHVGVSMCASSINGVHTVLRAPKGDGYATIMLAMFERLGVLPPLTINALTEGTLAGAPADLPRVLREIDARVKPKAILVTRSATAAVLQEPLDGEFGTMTPGELGAEVIFGASHPVRDNETTAFALTLRQLVAHVAADCARTETPSVNILGPALLGFHDHSNVRALRALFAAIGVDVNAVVPLGATVDDLRTLGRAWLNVSLVHERTAPLVAYLRERYGTPSVDALPYGEAGTTRFLREVCATLELPADRIAAAARESQLGWYARTVDAHALSTKRVAVFGTPTTAAGIARVLHDELDMRVEWVGTYVREYGDWLSARVADVTGRILVTDDYREVAQAIDETRPDIVFGSQMERHAASAHGIPCAVISPPAHILNFPLSYAPFVAYEGANYLADVVNRTQVLGLEHHLIETFGPRGQGRFAEQVPEGLDEPAVAAAEGAPQWDPSAERLVGRIPFFVRKKARANIEKYAREQRLAVIDERVVLAAREHVGG